MERLPCSVIFLIVLVILVLFALFFIVIFKKIPTNDDTEATGYAINNNSLPTNRPRDPDIGGNIVNLSTNKTIDLDCPGIGNVVAAPTRAPPVEDEVADSSTVPCSGTITSTTITTGCSCWGIGEEMEIGLETPDKFIPLIKSCFDKDKKNVLYTQHFVTKKIKGRDTGGKNSSWREGEFYNLGKPVNKIYPKVEHRTTINRQIGLEDNDEKYVKSKGHYYLAKGHLTARTDFMYNAQQMATFKYINSAPQWQTLNAHNWYYFEKDLRDYASNNSVDLIVYTGTYGISTLPHEKTGVPVELYLYVDDNGKKAMPIPELLWKLAYDPVNKAGVVVLGINNPYQLDVEKSILCNDVADKLTWLNFDRSNNENGYMYACTVEEFSNIIQNIPNFDVQSILN